ncbi:MAG: hypothetical protein LQ352_005571, partial [Teloschistes flavicans]
IPPSHHHPPEPSSSLPTEAIRSDESKSSRYDSPVRGLARLIQLAPSLTLLDLTLTALPSGRYRVSVRRTGDISSGAASLGGVYDGEADDRQGVLGEIEIGEQDQRGILVGEIAWEVWELVGRGMCVEPVGTGGADGDVNGVKVRREREGGREVCGVVARSAGVWENEKVVCGCSGKTVWEEREEMVGKGMV